MLNKSNEILLTIKKENLAKVKKLISMNIEMSHTHLALINILHKNKITKYMKLRKISNLLKNNHLIDLPDGNLRKAIEEIKLNANEWLPEGTFLIAGRQGYRITNDVKAITKYANTMITRAMLSKQVQLMNCELQIGKELLK